MTKVLWSRTPARCLDCPHPVGLDGSHYYAPISGVIRCRECRIGLGHYLSMEFSYPGTWVEAGANPPRPGPRPRDRSKRWRDGYRTDPQR